MENYSDIEINLSLAKMHLIEKVDWLHDVDMEWFAVDDQAMMCAEIDKLHAKIEEINNSLSVIYDMQNAFKRWHQYTLNFNQ